MGQFTHKPRAMTMKYREPKRKCPKAVPRHFQTLSKSCSVVMGPQVEGEGMCDRALN